MACLILELFFPFHIEINQYTDIQNKNDDLKHGEFDDKLIDFNRDVDSDREHDKFWTPFFVEPKPVKLRRMQSRVQNSEDTENNQRLSRDMTDERLQRVWQLGEGNFMFNK